MTIFCNIFVVHVFRGMCVYIISKPYNIFLYCLNLFLTTFAFSAPTFLVLVNSALLCGYEIKPFYKYLVSK